MATSALFFLNIYLVDLLTVLSQPASILFLPRSLAHRKQKQKREEKRTISPRSNAYPWQLNSHRISQNVLSLSFLRRDGVFDQETSEVQIECKISSVGTEPLNREIYPKNALHLFLGRSRDG